MNPILAEIYSTIVPSMPFIVAAYALLWVVLLIWMFLQFQKQRTLEQQVMLLEEAVAQKAE